MANFKVNPGGMAAFEKQIQAKMAAAEKAANEAAAKEDTLDRKVDAFVRVLQRHGIKDVNRAEVRRQFEG